MYELYPFQRVDVDEFINDGHKAGLFAYEQALGKTPTATTLAVELGTEVNLIIAPQPTFAGWEEAVREQTDGAHELRWMKKDTKKGKQVIVDFYNKVPGFYFITWELMRRGVVFNEYADLVIADEVHAIQNQGGSDQNILINHIHSEYKVGLSGTAAGNKLQGIYGIISWLWPKKFKAYWPWLKKHFLLVGFGHALTPTREKRPGSVVSELPFYVRRLKKDHYAEMMPEPKKNIEYWVDLSDEQRRIYDDFERTSGAWLDENDEAAGFVYSQHSIVKMARLREIALANPVMHLDGEKYTTRFEEDAHSSKLDVLMEILTEREAGQPVLVYTHSKKFIPVVLKRLRDAGIEAREFTGDLNYRQKRKNIDEFGDKFQVLVATQASIGTGVDGLQHRCHVGVILSRDVKMIVNEQAKERLYRPGQKHPVQWYEIIANNTNDLDTNAKLDMDAENVSAMLDGVKRIN